MWRIAPSSWRPPGNVEAVAAAFTGAPNVAAHHFAGAEYRLGLLDWAASPRPSPEPPSTPSALYPATVHIEERRVVHPHRKTLRGVRS